MLRRNPRFTHRKTATPTSRPSRASEHPSPWSPTGIYSRALVSRREIQQPHRLATVSLASKSLRRRSVALGFTLMVPPIFRVVLPGGGKPVLLLPTISVSPDEIVPNWSALVCTGWPPLARVALSVKIVRSRSHPETLVFWASGAGVSLGGQVVLLLPTIGERSVRITPFRPSPVGTSWPRLK
jgi:hypothetical protein